MQPLFDGKVQRGPGAAEFAPDQVRQHYDQHVGAGMFFCADVNGAGLSVAPGKCTKMAGHFPGSSLVAQRQQRLACKVLGTERSFPLRGESGSLSGAIMAYFLGAIDSSTETSSSPTEAARATTALWCFRSSGGGVTA